MIGLVMPGMSVVSFLFNIPTAEQTRFGIEVEFLHKNVGSVGVVDQVFEVVIVWVLARTGVLCQARLNQVIDDVLVQTTIERDIRAAADGAIDVCLLCSTGIAGVDNHPLCALIMGFMQPLGANGVVFNGIGSDVHNDIGVLHVAPMSSH